MTKDKIHEVAIWCDKIAYENGLSAIRVINQLTQLKLELGTIEQAQEAIEKILQKKNR